MPKNKIVIEIVRIDRKEVHMWEIIQLCRAIEMDPTYQKSYQIWNTGRDRIEE